MHNWKRDTFARTEFQVGRQTVKTMVLASIIGVVIWSIAIGLLLKSCWA